MRNSGTETVLIKGDKNAVSGLLILLQNGFFLKVQVGCSIKEFLCDEIGISYEYISKRITTVFLDGKAVDDIDSAILADGSTLALSIAMPGLVGAMMRRGSIFASLRKPVTHQECIDKIDKKEGTLQIKLFNMVMNELGYGFLEKGIIVNSRDLFDCIKNQSIEFWQGCKEILINGKTIEPDLFHNGLYSLKGDFVFLSVIVNT